MSGDVHSLERCIDQLLGEAPLQDLSPEAANRIETLGLASLRRGRPLKIARYSRLIEAIAMIFFSLLGGGHLLWNLGQALAIYGLLLR